MNNQKIIDNDFNIELIKKVLDKIKAYKSIFKFSKIKYKKTKEICNYIFSNFIIGKLSNLMIFLGIILFISCNKDLENIL